MRNGRTGTACFPFFLPPPVPVFPLDDLMHPPVPLATPRLWSRHRAPAPTSAPSLRVKAPHVRCTSESFFAPPPLYPSGAAAGSQRLTRGIACRLLLTGVSPPGIQLLGYLIRFLRASDLPSAHRDGRGEEKGFFAQVVQKYPPCAKNKFISCATGVKNIPLRRK